MPVVCYFALLFRHNRGASRVLGAVYVFLRQSVLTVQSNRQKNKCVESARGLRMDKTDMFVLSLFSFSAALSSWHKLHGSLGAMIVALLLLLLGG
jgi:hypothetical protein